MVSGSFSDESGYESETGVDAAGAWDGVVNSGGGADESVPEPSREVAVAVVTNGLS